LNPGDDGSLTLDPIPPENPRDICKESFVRIFCVVILSFVLGIQGATASPELRPDKWARPVIGAKVGNLYQVSPELYRAEQPDTSDIPDLKALGIQTLMNLREYHSDAEVFQKSGIVLRRHAMAAGAVSTADLVTVLREIQGSPKPVLVHCWHGSDRTGFVVAGYRVVIQGWSKADAIDELRRGGFGYHERTYPNVKKAIEALDVEAVRQQVLGSTAR